jgi:hypothetical protein
VHSSLGIFKMAANVKIKKIVKKFKYNSQGDVIIRIIIIIRNGANTICLPNFVWGT